MIQPLAAACKAIDCLKLYISEIKPSYMLLIYVSIPQVDYDRRRLIAPNHTCTHMLNFALRVYHEPVRVVSIGHKEEDLLANPENEEWSSISADLCGDIYQI